jgi:uncharacterized membrane protein
MVMWESRLSIDIAAPIDTVYDYLSDFERHSEWSLGVSEIKQTKPGTSGVGAEYEVNEVVPVKFVSFTRVTALDRPNRIEWESWDGKTLKVSWTFELSAAGKATRVVQRSQVESTSILGAVLLRLMRKRQMPKENQQSLERIKSIIEQTESTHEPVRADVPAG